ncbi:MAG TPA: DUF2938 family protein [Gammaproteobacteria bacterium]|nr:DUF2938 family protein [Gammaproteobacteria bacterium]
MTAGPETALRAAAIGVGGTLALDVWAALLQRAVGTPATNWALVGRWLAHMREGRFVHDGIGKAAPVRGESALGWLFHYGVGAIYGLLLVAWQGSAWLQAPTVPAPLLLSLALLVAPYFVMMPGLGLGIAGARTPQPNLTRLKSVMGHTAFGLGMYAAALALNVWPGPMLLSRTGV